MVAETGISTTYETIPKLQTSQAGSRLSAVNSNWPKVVHHGSDDKEACREIKRDPAVLLSVARADSQCGHITHQPSAMLTLLRGGVGGVGWGEATWREGEGWRKRAIEKIDASSWNLGVGLSLLGAPEENSSVRHLSQASSVTQAQGAINHSGGAGFKGEEREIKKIGNKYVH